MIKGIKFWKVNKAARQLVDMFGQCVDILPPLKEWDSSFNGSSTARP